ncbi:MAG: glycosyltransferase family 1 protein [Opitutus sp.]|nr:glycosyltransferase family 1 protein [Opitutus sp.]
MRFRPRVPIRDHTGTGGGILPREAHAGRISPAAGGSFRTRPELKMRLAFVAYEFPPDTGGGGIGTYLEQVSRYFSASGHDVHIFAGTRETTARVERNLPTLTVHRLPCADSPAFRNAVVAPFLAEHSRQPFDILEAADFDAPALDLQHRLPDLACVVKLHTPRFFVEELNHTSPSRLQMLRIHLGAWRRGRLHRPEAIRSDAAAQAELATLQAAHLVSAPSHAIAEAAEGWLPGLRARVEILPLPFDPSSALLRIPITSSTGRVTFLGRLEERKGIVDLIDAVKLVLARVPQARFCIVGRSMPHSSGESMQAFLEGRLGRSRHAVEFTGAVSPPKIPFILAETDVLAVPSHWESYGLVCCEAMAAGRPVIGGARGGMAEILEHGNCGKLVEPRQPGELASLIIRLLEDPVERERLGTAGRARVLRDFSLPRIAEAQLASYRRAMDNRLRLSR